MTVISRDFQTVNYAIIDTHGYEIHCDQIVVDIDASRNEIEAEARLDWELSLADLPHSQVERAAATIGDIVIG